ncbi:MAG: low molecular weight phosphatase family protein [Actinomycetota bacterium]|nr:low molecular weight phosphatase family protein [Actinomycetota bacterium]
MNHDVADVLVVCTGNIARSPFAEKLLEREARRRLGSTAAVRVRSAGVHGLVGRAAVGEMRQEAGDRGLDLSGHRGAAATADLVGAADVVIAMTEAHRRALVQLTPAAKERVFTLKELARLTREVDAPPEGLSPRQRLREVARTAHRARAYVPPDATADDVADPYGGPREGYRRCAAEIDDLVAAVAPVLFGPASR